MKRSRHLEEDECLLVRGTPPRHRLLEAEKDVPSSAGVHASSREVVA